MTTPITRDRFCAVQARRGYEVENLGLITFLRHTDKDGAEYVAMWFWHEDGTLNEAERPYWHLTPPAKR